MGEWHRYQQINYTGRDGAKRKYKNVTIVDFIHGIKNLASY